MPLYEIDADGELIPFRRLHGGADLYESELENLFWANAEEFIGEPLFPIARQPTLPTGGRPDIVALDSAARIVVVEVKRDIDRGQLAQCLEYAGWARTAGLDELARMYHRGVDSFFEDWQAFTESHAPVVVVASPRLILVAGDFHGRTKSAFDYLIENGVPLKLVPVAIYQDAASRKFLDIDLEHEPELAVPPITEPEDLEISDWTLIEGRRVRMSDLLDAGLLDVGEELVWERPRLGEAYHATVTETGALRLADGRQFASPSRAGMEAAGMQALDGWLAWKAPRRGDLKLDDLRYQLAVRLAHEASRGNGT